MVMKAPSASTARLASETTQGGQRRLIAFHGPTRSHRVELDRVRDPEIDALWRDLTQLLSVHRV
jgi:hypothetical protein